jgi:hypothetical protein
MRIEMKYISLFNSESDVNKIQLSSLSKSEMSLNEEKRGEKEREREGE